MPILGIVGGSQAFSSASGGKTYAFNGLTTALTALVAPANPSRQKIRFHNPGSVDIFIYPANAQSITTGSNVALVPSTVNLGGCTRVYGNGGTLEITGECQGQWGAFAADNTGTSLTVMDSNVS
jgi:hypothetical protein